MNRLLNLVLKEEVQNFIFSHEKEDVGKLLLRHKTLYGVPTEWIANQLIGRLKAKSKYPLLYRQKGIIYPPTLHLEQSSSEAAAGFKLDVLRKLLSPRLAIGYGADLTGGFGIDTYFLSLHAEKLDYVEPDEGLAEIARHNHALLGAHNISYHVSTAEDFLKETSHKFDFIYLDPSRRKGHQKVYKLVESEPDVVKLQSNLLHRSNSVLIKTSPLLDLQQGCRELQHVSQIIVVAVENECKELLFLLRRDFDGDPKIRAVDLSREGKIHNSVTFTQIEEQKSVLEFSSPLSYLYEPGAAILKAGAFKWMAQHYKLKKLGPNTHLYTSDSLSAFPGRIFKVIDQVKPDKKLVSRFPNGYANILTRNYPLQVAEIKKKTGLKEGGELYLICTQSGNTRQMIVAERIQ